MKLRDSNSSGVSHNTLAQGTLMKGDIKAEEDLRIDGRVEGIVECTGKVVVGPHAEIIGDIYCLNVDVIGTIKGKLQVKETFSMKSTANFTGEVIAGSLEIEPGAIFNGICKMQ